MHDPKQAACPSNITWAAAESVDAGDEPTGTGGFWFDHGELLVYEPAPLAPGEAAAFRLRSVDGGLLVTLYGKAVHCTCDSYRTQHGPKGERCRHGQALLELGVMEPKVDRAIQRQKKSRSR